MGDWLEESMNKPKPKKQTSRKLTQEQRAAVDAAKDRTAAMLASVRSTTDAAKALQEMKKGSPVKYDAAMAAAEKQRQKKISQSMADASQLYEAGPIRDMKTEAAAEGVGRTAAKMMGKAATTSMADIVQARMAGEKAKQAASAALERRPQKASMLNPDIIRRGLTMAATAPAAFIPAGLTELYARKNPAFRAAMNKPFMSQGAIDKAEKEGSEGMSAQDQRFKIMLDAVRRAQRSGGQ